MIFILLVSHIPYLIRQMSFQSIAGKTSLTYRGVTVTIIAGHFTLNTKQIFGVPLIGNRGIIFTLSAVLTSGQLAFNGPLPLA